MADNTTPAPLEFSDLIHSPLTQSPSPPPNDDLNDDLDDPVDQAELELMRNTVIEMGYHPSSKQHWSDKAFSRERILANMVLRLTRAGAPLTSQIVHQAESISQLVDHIGLISQTHVQERERWEAERFSSSRVTEALLTRARKEGIIRYEELERENSVIISDNRILQNRLQETQSRLNSLEAELHALRPYFITKSDDSLQMQPNGSLTSRSQQRSQRPERDPKALSDDEALPDSYPLVVPKHNAFKSPTTADARTEHMLLAARKLGRERAARIAPPVTLPTPAFPPFPGFFLPINAYIPPKPPIPATPNGSHPTVSTSPNKQAVAPGTPTTKPLVRLPFPQISPNPYMRPNAAANYAAAAAAGKTSAKALPAVSKKPNADGLESLLTAAKRVFDPDATGSTTNASKKRRTEPPLQTGLVADLEQNETTNLTPPNNEGQAMSALDVLADQAAAFGSGNTDTSDSGDDGQTGIPQRLRSATNSRLSARSKAVAQSGPSAVKASSGIRPASKIIPAGHSYANYVPDYKIRPLRGPLPPAPDYSAPFGRKNDSKGKGKAPTLPVQSLPRAGPIMNPYTTRPPPVPSNIALPISSPARPPVVSPAVSSVAPHRTPNPKPLPAYSALPLSATRSTSSIGLRISTTRQAHESHRSSSAGSSSNSTSRDDTPGADSHQNGNVQLTSSVEMALERGRTKTSQNSQPPPNRQLGQSVQPIRMLNGNFTENGMANVPKEPMLSAASAE